MIAINNISYYIGGRALYENASLHIKQRDKIGLIGLNGKGKSTLLKLINGDYMLDAGSISKSNDCTIGFLNQDSLSFQSEESILAVTMAAFKEALDTQLKIDKILKKLETDYSDDLINKLTKLQEKFEQLDGYTIQSKAEEVLEGMGFSTADLKRPLKEFSGGWRMRVIFAKLLLEKPSLLMLDEPTNHLDLPAIEWVENYLRDYEGAIIVVSHDRYFIDNVVTRTVEVTSEQLISYEGNYSFYLQEKSMRQEIQKNAFENQQQKIRQTERFIERFKAKASKARQVQSRVKSLERLDKVEDVTEDNAAVNFKFQFSQQPGRVIAELENVSKSYGELQILKDAHARIERGDKIALIGANGKGKSTLLRIIAGTEQAQGNINIGYNVIPAFYAQHQLEALHIENEILEELKQSGSGKTEQELRGVLGCFLFSDDDVFKKIKVLSGGEKSRVALAKTLISEANFLLLDEPTNHLDFISENILIQALQQYKGSFIVVSHNRHFVTQIANKIWYIEGNQIKEYPGTYEEYDYWVKKNAESAIKQIPVTKTEVKPKQEKPKIAANNQEAQLLKKLNKEINSIENKIELLEKEKEKMEVELSKPEVYSNPDLMIEKNKGYQEITEQLLAAQSSWEQLMLEAEAAEKIN
jgi:ATP-binding cassette, subfamily F, member 3